MPQSPHIWPWPRHPNYWRWLMRGAYPLAASQGIAPASVMAPGMTTRALTVSAVAPANLAPANASYGRYQYSAAASEAMMQTLFTRGAWQQSGAPGYMHDGMPLPPNCDVQIGGPVWGGQYELETDYTRYGTLSRGAVLTDTPAGGTVRHGVVDFQGIPPYVRVVLLADGTVVCDGLDGQGNSAPGAPSGQFRQVGLSENSSPPSRWFGTDVWALRSDGTLLRARTASGGAWTTHATGVACFLPISYSTRGTIQGVGGGFVIDYLPVIWLDTSGTLWTRWETWLSTTNSPTDGANISPFADKFCWITREQASGIGTMALLWRVTP